MNLRVVKLGGSLFDLPDLGRRLNLWLSQQPPKPTVLIAGGGMFTDGVRKFDCWHQLDSIDSHRLAMHSMSLSAYALSLLMPNAAFVSGFDAVRSKLAIVASDECSSTYVGVWDAIDYWVRKIEPGLTEATLDWTLTSDSIAAVLARKWHADSFVLAKSRDQPAKPKWEWSGDGIVDAQFAKLSASLDVSWVNLRAPEYDDHRA
ncbi:amino acid kinase family protein [Blastopirellula retiformator]|uniref:Aspartate/glutamate/uridylate kinase domain-containing protein n=1 Tax=Blastopirellula retiformator TaxID=2527970 RepID=A0A5C5V0M2_9BACT|nr:hypothetical protein [Blastopirellula retiformator]TWT32116.1 hypothetical protein Enr8_40420 [Blastopirellula retiformator]